jgi:hypothetical protein
VFRPPPRLTNMGSLHGLLRAAYPPFSVSLLLLGRCLALRTSENAQKANFGEFLFHALR